MPYWGLRRPLRAIYGTFWRTLRAIMGFVKALIRPLKAIMGPLNVSARCFLLVSQRQKTCHWEYKAKVLTWIGMGAYLDLVEIYGP